MLSLRDDITKALSHGTNDSGVTADRLLALPAMMAREAVCDASLRIRRLKPGTVEHNKAWADYMAAVAALDALEQQ